MWTNLAIWPRASQSSRFRGAITPYLKASARSFLRIGAVVASPSSPPRPATWTGTAEPAIARNHENDVETIGNRPISEMPRRQNSAARYKTLDCGPDRDGRREQPRRIQASLGDLPSTISRTASIGEIGAARVGVGTKVDLVGRGESLEAIWN